MMGKIVLAGLVVLLSAGAALASDIARDGKVRVPDKQEAIAICKKNPYLDNNVLLASCVRMEQDNAQQVLSMISQNRDAASQAYWNCVKNPYIDNYSLLAGCMQQELEAGAFLSQ